MKFLLRLLYILAAKLFLFPVLYYAIKKELHFLPKKFFYFDNAEDGYTGNKRGWYDGYLGIVATDFSVLKQAWLAYRWSCWRNPCWNLRYHDYISIDLNGAYYSPINGNTLYHDYAKGFQFYDIVIHGKYKAHFRLYPLTKNKSLYVRWGWKIYPQFDTNNLPKYKDRSIQAITLRIRGPE